jgi:transposase-like protein
MVCCNCNLLCKKFGKFGSKKIQRYRCKKCGRTFSDLQEKPLDEMRIPLEKALQALNLMVEGCGIRSISRITGLHIETVLALLEKAVSFRQACVGGKNEPSLRGLYTVSGFCPPALERCEPPIDIID